MAIADGGELIVLAPGVAKFGEDAKCDELIRASECRRSATLATRAWHAAQSACRRPPRFAVRRAGARGAARTV
jgi:hypothetical protein